MSDSGSPFALSMLLTLTGFGSLICIHSAINLSILNNASTSILSNLPLYALSDHRMHLGTMSGVGPLALLVNAIIAVASIFILTTFLQEKPAYKLPGAIGAFATLCNITCSILASYYGTYLEIINSINMARPDVTTYILSHNPIQLQELLALETKYTVAVGVTTTLALLSIGVAVVSYLNA